MKAVDISGQRYGRLVGVRRDPTPGDTYWLFRCDCGVEKVIRLDPVRRGKTSSCGCVRTEMIRGRSLTHGHKIGRQSTPTLRAYHHAKARCQNPNDAKFPAYGGRGIQMCDRWSDSFEAFLSDMGDRPEGLTLERIDVNGNYEPDNCRWATRHDQTRNKTTNVFVNHDGERIILKDFADAMGVNYKALHARVRSRGEDPHLAAAALRAPGAL